MAMRITKYDGADSGAILRLGGRLVAEGAAILERHGAGPLRRAEGLNLDLVGSSFVDRAGIEVLRRLARAGAQLRCPSRPVASVLVGAGVRVVLDAEPAEPRRPL